MQVRAAVAADVPAVARLVLAALANEHPWSAVVPPRLALQPSSAACAAAVLADLIDKSSVLVAVLELSEAENPSHDGPLLVSASVWDLASSSPPCQSPCYTAALTTADSVRSHSPATSDALVALATACYTEPLHRPSRHSLVLSLLATLPEFGRRGFGRILARRGAEMAMSLSKMRHAPVYVQAGPTAYVLFSDMGFRDVGAVDLPCQSGSLDPALYVKTMVLDHARHRHRQPPNRACVLLRRLARNWA